MKRRELLALLPDDLKKRAPHKRSENGPVNFEYQGFKVQIIGYFSNYLGLIQTDTGALFWVRDYEGQPFVRRKRVRQTCKTVIKWHIKFGGWVLPKRPSTRVKNNLFTSPLCHPRATSRESTTRTTPATGWSS